MTTPSLTAFYDGACPLCLREIAFYRRRRGAARIAWIDLSALPAQTAAPGLSKCDALARFHVMDDQGVLYAGGDAFAKIWLALPSLRILGLIAGVPPFRWMLNKAYNAFLSVRPRLQRLAARAAQQRP